MDYVDSEGGSQLKTFKRDKNFVMTEMEEEETTAVNDYCQNLEIGNESLQNSEIKQLDVENGSLRSSHRKYQEISSDRIEEITSNAPFNAEKAKPFQIRRESTLKSEIENSGHSKTK